MTRSYGDGASCRTPPSLRNSATTFPFPRSLMLLIRVSGNVFSRPTRIPTRFINRYPFEEEIRVRRKSVTHSNPRNSQSVLVEKQAKYAWRHGLSNSRGGFVVA